MDINSISTRVAAKIIAFTEAEEFVDEFGKKAEAIIKALGFKLDDITHFSHIKGRYQLEAGRASFIGFDSFDDAKDAAMEDFKQNAEYANREFLEKYINDKNAEKLFRGMYNETNEIYASDIRSEPSRQGYTNRLIDELVDRDIIDDEKAEKLTEKKDDGAKHIGKFVENMTDEQINQGQGGLDYYVMNFGADEAWKLIQSHNMIDLDKAAINAVKVDGVAHFLAGYDGDEINAEKTYWYRTN